MENSSGKQQQEHRQHEEKKEKIVHRRCFFTIVQCFMCRDCSRILCHCSETQFQDKEQYEPSS